MPGTMRTGLCHKLSPVSGRLLLSAIFLMSAGNKIANWEMTVESVAAEGVPLAPAMLAGATVLELCGGVSVLLGCWARLGATLLIIFLIPTTLIMHDFWTFEGQEQQMQMIQFMKNLTIMGGLFLVLGFGAGPISLDGKRSTTGTGPPSE